MKALFVLVVLPTLLHGYKLRDSRVEDARSLLTRRAQLNSCVGKAPEGDKPNCPEGCVDPTEECPIDIYKKDLTKECDNIAKEIGQSPTDKFCEGIPTTDPEACNDAMKDALDQQQPPAEDKFCECMKGVSDCEKKKKECCDEVPKKCGPWTTETGICTDCKVSCDFGEADKTTDEKFYLTCLADMEQAINKVKQDLLGEQGKVNLEKKECKEKKDCCAKPCPTDVCEEKCRTVEAVKTAVCGTYDTCWSEAEKKVQQAMTAAQNKAKELSGKMLWLAEKECEIAGKRGALPPGQSVEQCKAAIDKNQCPAPICPKEPKKPCDAGKPAICNNPKAYEVQVCEAAPGDEPQVVAAKETARPAAAAASLVYARRH